VRRARGHAEAVGAARPRGGEGQRGGLAPGPPLTAPISRRECLLYRYQVSHLESRKEVRSSKFAPSAPPDRVVAAEGFAMTPSTIYAASGSAKLLTFAATGRRTGPDRSLIAAARRIGAFEGTFRRGRTL
jgi:hypothetical protein